MFRVFTVSFIPRRGGQVCFDFFVGRRSLIQNYDESKHKYEGHWHSIIDNICFISEFNYPYHSIDRLSPVIWDVYIAPYVFRVGPLYFICHTPKDELVQHSDTPSSDHIFCNITYKLHNVIRLALIGWLRVSFNVQLLVLKFIYRVNFLLFLYKDIKSCNMLPCQAASYFPFCLTALALWFVIFTLLI